MALLPLVAIFLVLLRNQQQQAAWQRVVDPELAPHVLEDQKSQRKSIVLFILSILWFISVFALAGPSWEQPLQTVYKKINARVIALDLSPNMNAQDLEPSRIARARYKIIDLLQQLQQGQVGLVAFTDEAYVVSPLTEDAATISAMVPQLKPSIMPTRGNDISSGLNLAGKLIKQAKIPNGEIILITGSAADAKDIATAQRLAAAGIKTSILAMATAHGAPIPGKNGYAQNNKGNIILSKLDQKNLASLAKAGAGIMQMFTPTDVDIKNLITATDDHQTATTIAAQNISYWHDQGYYLIWLLLPFVALIFRRGWLEQL